MKLKDAYSLERPLVAQMVKNMSAMQKTWVWSLGWEDPWRREWQPTPVFLPGKFYGQRNLVGYSSWGRKKWDMTEHLTLSLSLPWKESYDKPRQYIRKQRYHFAYKGPYNQSFGFSSSHVQCESWTIKKAECQRINAFILWCWRRLLRVPWTARRSNQSALKEIKPEYSLEWWMLKLKLQCLGYLMWRVDLLEKTLTLGKSEGKRRRGDRGWDGWMASVTQWT